MIKYLQIQNFQSHKDSLLTFDPGVNVIVGSSDSGKTAVIRALRWLVWNRPSGDAFRSNWGGETKAQLETEVGIVSRSKDKKDQYTARLKGMLSEVVFKAFGTNVPEEIIKALNIDEINLQQQLDRPFLLTDSPGEVARYFNRVANLDQIDTGMKNVQSQIRSIEQDIKSTEQQLKEQEEELNKYDYLDKLEAELEVLEDMNTHAHGSRMVINRLEGVIEEIAEVEKEIEKYSDILEMEGDVEKILSLYEKGKEKEQEISDLTNLILEAKETDNQLEELNHFISMEGDLKKVLLLSTELEERKKEINTFDDLISEIEDIENRIAHKEGKIEEWEKKFHDQFPAVCPLCSQKIKK